MNHKLIMAATVGAMLLGSCSGEQAGDAPPASGATERLLFGVQHVDTRGTSTTTASIREFGVFCFDTGHSKWTAAATPNKMFNQQVVHTPGDVWTYDPPAYWETYENKLHSFFAYSPLARGMKTDSINGMLNVGGNNLELMGTATTAGVPQLRLQLLDDVFEQIDLLIARPQIDLKPRKDAVKMEFDHALVRIGFRAFSDVAGTYIEKIEITGIPYKGTITMESSAAWTVDSGTKDFTIDYGNGTPILATEANPADISYPARYLLALPNTWTGNTTAKVKVRYRQDGQSIDKAFVIGATGEQWTQNRSVIYVLDLNGVPNNDLIVEKVIIEEWKMGIDAGTADTGLKGESYVLTFAADAGVTNLPASQTLETGTLYKIPDTVPVKAGGGTFAGWNTQANGTGTAYLAGERVPITDSNVTLYAQWQ